MPKTQPTATYDDVNLVIRLYELRRETKLRTARDWFISSCKPKSFEELMKQCPPGSPENTNLRMVASYWDMAASFITAGVLNAGLFFESNREMLVVWERLKPAIKGLREAYQDQLMMSNLESVAADYVGWMEERQPGSYKAWLSNTVTER
ncbi:MAG: hypothetical protein FJW20_08510 [Acidimicrobiia bacterium]|nr:hypothetical protein [Acidimicrobiia bacterium]